MSKVLSFLSAHKRALKVLILLCVIGYLLNSLDYFLRVDTCIDGGLVWDYDEHRCRDDCLTFVKGKGCIHRCRDDCLTFVKGKGCIYMHQAYREVFEGCPYSSEECEKRMDKELFIMCEKYQGAWNLDDKTCDFHFSLEECGKLEGNWQYPSACKQTQK